MDLSSAMVNRLRDVSDSVEVACDVCPCDLSGSVVEFTKYSCLNFVIHEECGAQLGPKGTPMFRCLAQN